LLLAIAFDPPHRSIELVSLNGKVELNEVGNGRETLFLSFSAASSLFH
jgi:hypothetical protein